MNFNDWAKANPTKSLNDYYKAQEIEANLQRAHTPTNSSPPANNMWGILSIVLSLFFGGFCMYGYMKHEESKAPPVTAFSTLKTGITPVSEQLTESEVQKRVQAQQEYESDRENLRNNWRDLITVKFTNDRPFLGGGFRDVPITVTNTLPYEIDEVTVLVTLIKGIWNKRVCYTGIVTFENIKAFDSSMSLFSHEECGLDFKVQIVALKCRKLNVNLKTD